MQEFVVHSTAQQTKGSSVVSRLGTRTSLQSYDSEVYILNFRFQFIDYYNFEKVIYNPKYTIAGLKELDLTTIQHELKPKESIPVFFTY